MDWNNIYIILVDLKNKWIRIENFYQKIYCFFVGDLEGDFYLVPLKDSYKFFMVATSALSLIELGFLTKSLIITSTFSYFEI